MITYCLIKAFFHLFCHNSPLFLLFCNVHTLKIAAVFYPSGFFKRVANFYLRYERSTDICSEYNFTCYNFLNDIIKQAVVKRFSRSSSGQMSGTFIYVVVANVNCCNHFIFKVKFFWIYIIISKLNELAMSSMIRLQNTLYSSGNIWTLHSFCLLVKELHPSHTEEGKWQSM